MKGIHAFLAKRHIHCFGETLLPADSLIPQEFKFGSSTDLIREFTLTGLRPEVSYYYFVTVIDASGNMTQSVSHGEFHTRAI